MAHSSLFLKSLTRPFVVLLWGTLSFSAYAQAPVIPTQEVARDVESVAAHIQTARSNIEVVEKQYSQAQEVSARQEAEERFSKAETRYLLQEYQAVSVLFYDLVSNKDFKSSQQYPTALFYLSDSLYQQKNMLGSRVYLRELLALKGPHYQDALIRYLEIAAHLNEYSGIEDLMKEARRTSSNVLPPELNYAYAKWVFRRQDIELQTRISDANAVFSNLAEIPGSNFQLPSAYFIGVGLFKLKKWPEAIQQFEKVTKLQPTTENDFEIIDLAQLSIGRIQFEMGKYDEAIIAYAKVRRESPSFAESLYETAWCYVKKDDLQKANNMTELLMLVAEDSPIAAEGKILQGTLQMKLQLYEETAETFRGIVNTYSPVRDALAALISSHQDPVKYFDDLLSRSDKSLDVTALLPKVALQWASTRNDISQAIAIVGGIDSSRKGIDEGQAIVQSLLHTLEASELDAFPFLLEGYSRADSIETSLTRAEEGLTEAEGKLLGPYLLGGNKDSYLAAQRRVASLKTRIAQLPKNEAEWRDRRNRLRAKIDELDVVAYKVQLETQSLLAQIEAINKYAEYKKGERKSTAAAENDFFVELMAQKEILNQTETDLSAYRQSLIVERNSSASRVAGEDVLRIEYEKALSEARATLEPARGQLSTEIQGILLRTEALRMEAKDLKTRVDGAKAALLARVSMRSQKLKENVLAEQTLLNNYNTETGGVSDSARGVVGRVALDSFRKVHKGFYDLVLKADVGLVDVTFTKKQDQTNEIQKVAQQKERDLKQLDNEFKEVLKDVDTP